MAAAYGEHPQPRQRFVTDKWATVTPGSMGACALAIDLFGLDRINPGSWLTPVYVQVEGLSASDLRAAEELLVERGLTFKGWA